MRALHITMLLAATAAAASSGAAPAPAPAPAPKAKDVVELIKGIPDLSFLFAALSKANLTDALSGSGPFTIFAPVDAAFSKLSSSALGGLSANKLGALLQYHVIKGSRILQKDLLSHNQTLKTLGGEDVSIMSGRTPGEDVNPNIPPAVRINGSPGLGGSVVLAHVGGSVGSEFTDFLAGNGVVHLIDSVLEPPSVNIPKDHLWFHLINDKDGRCGEVDAATRMPASLFGPQYKTYLQVFTAVTVKILQIDGYKLATGRCAAPYTYKGGQIPSQWIFGDVPGQGLPETLIVVCEKCCPGEVLTYPCSHDLPDKPGDGQFCSLCGPTMNEFVDIQLYYKTPQKK